jgi:UDP-glucose 4-epimerase
VKILVTGGAGHIGSHVIELLVQDPKNTVISLDNYFTGKEANHIAGAEYRKGHTKDIEQLVPETPDVVYHLGEYARIAPSIEEPDLVYDMNTAGTTAVLEFCRTRKVGKLVYAGSSTRFAVEGNGRHQNPYSFSKAVNVDLVNDYGKWYGLPYAICYFYNAFGARETGTGKYFTLIARFEQLYLAGKPLTVDPPGTQKRNFTFVGDIARGMILTAQKGSGDGYSLNNQKQFSVLDIAKAFGGEFVFTERYSGRSGSDDIPEKAREELGWDTTVDILDYIQDFVKTHPRPKK